VLRADNRDHLLQSRIKIVIHHHKVGFNVVTHLFGGRSYTLFKYLCIILGTLVQAFPQSLF